MGTRRVQMKGVLPWGGYLGLPCRYKRFLSSLGCCSWSSTTYFFPHPTLCPHGPASCMGRQPCWIACLLVSVFGMNRAFERKSKQVTDTSPCMVVGCKLYSSTSFQLFSIYWRPFITLLSFLPWGWFFHEEYSDNAGKDRTVVFFLSIRKSRRKYTTLSLDVNF
jgi:hypothetical protein